MSDRRSRALLALIVLAFLAVLDGLYLTVVHIDYLVGKPGLSMVCHALAEQGCAVTAGRFGDIAGIPVALIGFAGATTTFVLGIAAWWRRKRDEDPMREVVFLLGAASLLASLVMAGLSTIEGSYCPFCVLWYLLNFGIAATAYAARDDERLPIGELAGSGGAAVAIFAIALFGGRAWHDGKIDALIEERAAFIDAFVAEIKKQGQTPLELDDPPTKGPDNAAVTIVEFSDFQCPFCRRLWDGLEELEKTSSQPIKFVFAHFPLDQSCNPPVQTQHPDACRAAQAAECARKDGKFWDYGSLLFANQHALSRDDLIGYAEQLGLSMTQFRACLDDPSVLDEIGKDIVVADRIGIKATPTFFINGYLFKGALPPPILDLVIQRLAATP